MLEKVHGRMRFIADPTIYLESKTWQSQYFNFKHRIRTHSNYQIIDQRTFWLCNAQFLKSIPMVPVIGAPAPLDFATLTFDTEMGPYWVEQLESTEALSGNLVVIETQVLGVLSKIPPELAKNFHLVIEEEKIELHFFLEKDYIG